MGVRFISYLFDIMDRELGLSFNSWICWHYWQSQRPPHSFTKSIGDRPAGADDGSDDLKAVINILVPALTSRARQGGEVGDVTTIEVPGLAEALNRPSVLVALELTCRSGEVLTASIKIPDERSALVLKTMAWQARRAGKDAVDVWRCLEIALAAGLGFEDFRSDDGERALEILDRAFGSATSDGLAACAETEKLNEAATRSRATRIRALVARLRA